METDAGKWAQTTIWFIANGRTADGIVGYCLENSNLYLSVEE
jgi:hypothetical protein